MLWWANKQVWSVGLTGAPAALAPSPAVAASLAALLHVAFGICVGSPTDGRGLSPRLKPCIVSSLSGSLHMLAALLARPCMLCGRKRASVCACQRRCPCRALQTHLNSMLRTTAALGGACRCYAPCPQMERPKKLHEHIGKNEKTKIVAKLTPKGAGAPVCYRHTLSRRRVCWPSSLRR